MRAPLLVALTLVGGIAMVSQVTAAEQAIEPLTPPEEQRLEIVTPPTDGEARVDGVEVTDLQHLSAPEPPSPAAKAASVAGKVVLGVAAAGISIAAMVASLLFL